MPSVRQTNFSAGEVAPGLWGRTDLAVHSKGLRTLKNFFVSKEGPVVSRPGTKAVRQTGVAPRLIPFVISDTESYVIEFSAHIIRLHRNGATLLSNQVSLSTSLTDGVAFQITLTEYEAEELRDIRYAQVGDVMILTHPNYPARQLRRIDGSWVFDTIDFTPQSPIFLLMSDQTQALITPRLVNDGSLFFFDADHPAREWRYKVSTTLRERATGKTFETLAFSAGLYYDGTTVGSGTLLPADGKIVLYPDRPVTLRSYSTGADPYSFTTRFEVLGTNFYRGRGKLFGFIGTTTTLEFVDNGAEPDYLTQPLLADPPFQVGEHPIAVTHFQERRVFGGTTLRPIGIVSSAVGNYSDFDKHILPVSGEALELELATHTREQIRWVLGQRHLIIGTDTNIWALGGTDSEVLDFDSVYARPIDSVGATGLRPLVIGNTVTYVRTKGRGVRALTQTDGGWQPADITTYAKHLFVGGERPVGALVGAPANYGRPRNIVDWCYAEDPWGLIWAVRDDGVLLSCTICPDGTIGWARHETDGIVMSICSVPEGTEDAVYMVVMRRGESYGSGTYFLERMTNRVQNDSPEDGACVDSCVRYRTTPQLTYTGLTHLEGKQVYAVAVDNVPQGPFTVVGGSITLNEMPTPNDFDAFSGGSLVVMFIGLPFTCDIETLDWVGGDSGRLRQKTVTSVGFEVSSSRGLNVGQDFNHLVEWRQRSVADSYGAPSAATDLVKSPVLGTHDYFARAALRQTLPLPVTVLGLVREVVAGD